MVMYIVVSRPYCDWRLHWLEMVAHCFGICIVAFAMILMKVGSDPCIVRRHMTCAHAPMRHDIGAWMLAGRWRKRCFLRCNADGDGNDICDDPSL